MLVDIYTNILRPIQSDEYYVVASAFPCDMQRACKPAQKSATAPSMEEARKIRMELARSLHEFLTSLGHEVRSMVLR